MQRVGDYEVLETLGQGTSGQVLLVRRAGIERTFALKLLPRNLGGEALARLEREARIASRLDHPGLVRVVDVGRVERCPFLVMEHVPGPDLLAWMERRGAIPWREALGMVEKLAEALQAAHASGVIHRDLKPANVIVDARDGRLRITDFGLAHETDSDLGLTAAGDVLGTPYYMAPEQVRGDPVDPRWDVYALGVILYELISGVRPYESQNVPELYRMIQEGHATPLAQLDASVPPEVAALCHRAFAREAAERPADAGALAAEIAALDPARAPAPEVEQPLVRAGWPAWGLPAVAGAWALALALGVMTAVQIKRVQAEREAVTAARARAEVAQAALVAAQGEAEDQAAQVAEARASLEASTRAADALREQLAEAQAALDREARVGAEPLGTLAAAIDAVCEELGREQVAPALRANLLRNRGRFPEAAQAADQAWAAGERDPELLVVSFRAWMAAGVRAPAAESIARLLEVAPAESLPALFARAVSGGVGDDLVERLSAADAAGQEVPVYLWILAGRAARSAIRRAPAAESRAAIMEVLALGDRAVAADPCCPDARELRTWALLELRRLGAPAADDVERMLWDCRVAREVHPDPDHWLRLGELLVLADRPELGAVELDGFLERASPRARDRLLDMVDPQVRAVLERRR